MHRNVFISGLFTHPIDNITLFFFFFFIPVRQCTNKTSCNILQSPVMASNKRTKHLPFKITFPYYLGIPLQCQMIDNEQKNITYLKYIATIYLMMRKGVMFS